MTAIITRRAAPRRFVWFLDGVGLSAPDHPANPLLAQPLPGFTRVLAGPPVHAAGLRIADGAALAALDARLGVPGLPQSATGQTTLLTGVNAAQTLGRHLTAYPTPTLIRLLRQDNLLMRLAAQGRRVAYLNYFSDRFVWLFAEHKRRLGWRHTAAQRAVFAAAAARLDGNPPPVQARRRFRPAACVVAADAAGLPLRDRAAKQAGLAVDHDIVGGFIDADGRPNGWPPAEDDVLAARVAEAVERAVRVWRAHDLTFYETFLTDALGHAQAPERARAWLRVLDRFLQGLLAALDPERDQLIVISDHGNFEDLSVRTHTLHPVPFAAYGVDAPVLVAGATSLCDVAPRLLAAYDS